MGGEGQIVVQLMRGRKASISGERDEGERVGVDLMTEKRVDSDGVDER